MIVNKLEIFILTYNRESKLERTLQMLSNSSLKDLKITIMNNASTDGTLSKTVFTTDYYSIFYR